MRVGTGISGGLFFTEMGETLFKLPGTVVQYLFPSTLPSLPSSTEIAPPAPVTDVMLKGAWTPKVMYEVMGQERERALAQGQPVGPEVAPSKAETPWGTYALVGIGILVVGAMVGGRR